MADEAGTPPSPTSTNGAPRNTDDEPKRAAWIVGTTIVAVVAFLALSAWLARFFAEDVRTPFLIVAGFVALVGLLGGIAIAFRSILLMAVHTSSGKTAPVDNDVPAIRAAVVVMATIVIVFSLLAGLAKALKSNDLGDDAVRLPLLVIAGLVSLIALLAVMAIAFKTVHLANKTQALGLPDGTVRAVIALSLILIFAVVTVYLFSDLSNNDSVECEELQDIKKQLANNMNRGPAGRGDSAQLNPSNATNPNTPNPNTPNPNTPNPNTPNPNTPNPNAPNPNNPNLSNPNLNSQNPSLTGSSPQTTPTLSAADDRRKSKLAASQDFAKQLLIMLGTLITSITSFYFASKTGDGSSARTTPPTSSPAKLMLGAVDPPKVPRTEIPPTFTVSGSGLLAVNAIALSNNAVTVNISGADVLSADTAVQFKVPKDLAVGTWDLTAKSSDGGQASLSNAIEIT
jgi:hypothetical protein